MRAPDDKPIEIQDEAATVHQILMRLRGNRGDEWEWKKKIHPSGVCMILLEVARTAIPNQFEKRPTFIPVQLLWPSACLLHFKPLQLRNCSL